MKLRSVRFGAIIFIVLVALSSCLGDNDDVDYTYADDAAITSFSLGTLNKYLKTVSANTGNDTIVKSTVTGSSYKFYIDQKQNIIYNPDSLPYGVDVKHVIVNVGTYNSGTAVLQSLTSDSIKYISSSDFIDFSEPRIMKVYSLSGKGVRNYTVKVNVHQQQADDFEWHKMTTEVPFADCIKMRGLAVGDAADKQLLAAALYSDGVRLYTSDAEGVEWKQMATPEGLDEEGMSSLCLHGNVPTWCSNGTIYRTSSDGTSEKVYSAEGLTLLGATLHSLYARVGNEVMKSADGASWEVLDIDGDISFLPTTDMFLMWKYFNEDNKTDLRVTLMGNRSAEVYPDDQYALVWGYIEQNNSEAELQPLSFYEWSDANSLLPYRLGGMQCARSGNAFYMIGLAGIGNTHYQPLQGVYRSEDSGLTWQQSDIVTVPMGFTSPTDAFAFFGDNENFLWIICGGSGNVWRGRINKDGWTAK